MEQTITNFGWDFSSLVPVHTAENNTKIYEPSTFPIFHLLCFYLWTYQLLHFLFDILVTRSRTNSLSKMQGMTVHVHVVPQKTIFDVLPPPLLPFFFLEDFSKND